MHIQITTPSITAQTVIAAGGDFIPFLPLSFSIDERDYLDAEELAEYESVKNDEVCQIFLDRIGMIDTAKSIVADRREYYAERHRRDIIDAFDRPLEHDADTEFYAEIAETLQFQKDAAEIDFDDDYIDPRDDYDALDCLFFEDE